MRFEKCKLYVCIANQRSHGPVVFPRIGFLLDSFLLIYQGHHRLYHKVCSFFEMPYFSYLIQKWEKPYTVRKLGISKKNAHDQPANTSNSVVQFRSIEFSKGFGPTKNSGFKRSKIRIGVVQVLVFIGFLGKRYGILRNAFYSCYL